MHTCPKLPPPPDPDACRQRTCFVALCSELLTFCCSIWQDAEGKEHEVLLNRTKTKAVLRDFSTHWVKRLWVIHFGFIWYFLKSFCEIQGMLHWNSFQSYCFDPWSGCCSGLPGTFWLCRWSAKWVVVAGFGVDVLLVSNWLDVFANIGTESSIAIRNPSHHKIPTFVETFQVTSPARLGFTLWCPFATSKVFQNRIFKRIFGFSDVLLLVFASKFFGFSEATGRPKDSGPLSPCPALPGDTVASTAAQPRFRKRRPTQRIAWFQCWSPQP